MDNSLTTRDDLEALLRFYSESGLDFPVEAEPVNRFEAAQTAAPQEERTQRAQAPERAAPRPRPTDADADMPPPTIPDGDALAMAQHAAASASSLDQLAAAIAGFEACNLKRSARNTVFESGDRAAPIMIIGGAPGRDDDASGQGWSGADGLLLETMLGAIGLSRKTVYCGFCVPWHPPGGSAPSALNLALCAPFLDRQIALAKPKIIVALGNVAARHMTGSRGSILALRGQWSEHAPSGALVTALHEPSMLREQPRLKRATWLDLLALKARLDALQ